MKKIIIHIIRRFAGVIIGLDLAESIKEQKQVENIRKSLKSCGEKVAFRFPLVIENKHLVEIASIDHDYCVKDMKKTVIKKPVIIGSGVWIGSHSFIFPGVKIGDGAVIGANTLVNKNVPDNAIFYGSPGRVVKYRSFSKELKN